MLPIVSYAQDGLVKCGNPGGKPCELKDLSDLLIGIYNFLLGMAGLVAFVFLIVGGIRMFLYSVDEEHLAAGKKTIMHALIGLAIIAMAYLIVNTLLVVLGVAEKPSFYFSGAFLRGN